MFKIKKINIISQDSVLNGIHVSSEDKQCTKCKEYKSLNLFRDDKRIKSGKVSRCKDCESNYQLEYREKNKEKRKEANKKWREKNPNYLKEFKENNPEKIKERYKKENKRRSKNGYFKEYAKNNAAAIKAYAIEYEKKNAEKRKKQRAENRKIKMPSIRLTMNKWRKNKYDSDYLFKLKDNLRTVTRSAFISKRWNKNGKTEVLLGESFKIVMSHIEMKFTKGMTWKNKGKGFGKWEVDHIIPLSSAKTEEELRLLCHYTNLQPMWSKENNHKRAKLPKNYQMKLTV